MTGLSGYGGGATGLGFVGAGVCTNTGVILGSRMYTASSNDGTNAIEYVTIQTTGNGTDFGDLSDNGSIKDGCSNGTIGLFGGSRGSGEIDYFTCSTSGNATKFGNLTSDRGPGCGTDGCYALFGAGWNSGQNHRAIDYVCIATPGNASDFGDCTAGRHGIKGISDQVRVVFGGGENDSGGWTDVIDYVTVQTPGNASDFGDMTVARHGYAGYGNGTRGIMACGKEGRSSNDWTAAIDYITIDTTGNASDFGDATAARYSMGGACDATRGLQAGGYQTQGGGGSNLDVIDYITIDTTGNASDFGDLLVSRRSHACLSGGS